VVERVVFAPPLSEVPLPAPNAAALLSATASTRSTPAVPRFVSATRCGLMERSFLKPSDSPRCTAIGSIPSTSHVAVLLDNTPDYVFALCGAGLWERRW